MHMPVRTLFGAVFCLALSTCQNIAFDQPFLSQWVEYGYDSRYTIDHVAAQRAMSHPRMLLAHSSEALLFVTAATYTCDRQDVWNFRMERALPLLLPSGQQVEVFKVKYSPKSYVPFSECNITVAVDDLENERTLHTKAQGTMPEKALIVFRDMLVREYDYMYGVYREKKVRYSIDDSIVGEYSWESNQLTPVIGTVERLELRLYNPCFEGLTVYNVTLLPLHSDAPWFTAPDVPPLVVHDAAGDRVIAPFTIPPLEEYNLTLYVRATATNKVGGVIVRIGNDGQRRVPGRYYTFDLYARGKEPPPYVPPYEPPYYPPYYPPQEEEDGFNYVPIAIVSGAVVGLILVALVLRALAGARFFSAPVIGVAMATFDLVTDILFSIDAWRQDLPLHSILSAVFLGLPFLINIVLMLRLMSRELRTNPAFAEYADKRRTPLLLLLFFSATNLECLQLTQSKLCNAKFFDAPWSMAAQANLRIYALSNVLLEDIPQLTIQTLAAQQLRTWTVIQSISVFATSATIFFGVCKRLFGYIIDKALLRRKAAATNGKQQKQKKGAPRVVKVAARSTAEEEAGAEVEMQAGQQQKERLEDV